MTRDASENGALSDSNSDIELLPGGSRARSLIRLESVGSTNDHLKALARAGAPSGTAVLADVQTAGRGRLGRSFLSPAGEGVYLSVLLRPDCSAEAALQLTAWTAAAVCRALERCCGLSAGIKWVNDIILNGRKLGGILCETSMRGDSGRVDYVVAGVGLNVLQGGFPPELALTATSLLLETGRRFSRDAVAAALISELDRMGAEFPAGKERYLREYRAACITTGRDVCFVRDGERHTGTAESIDEDFGLVLRLPDGEREHLRSGEVSVRGLCGYV